MSKLQNKRIDMIPLSHNYKHDLTMEEMRVNARKNDTMCRRTQRLHGASSTRKARRDANLIEGMNTTTKTKSGKIVQHRVLKFMRASDNGMNARQLIKLRKHVMTK